MRNGGSLYSYVSFNPGNMVMFLLKNGDVPIENGDFLTKDCDLPMNLPKSTMIFLQGGHR